ncbi:MAG: putative toxin-antitoxin system toxin component, PIN family [Acidimicrobiia bacterium]|nr:putative toxin-antitoxin system toxin component, PIN family [Acidimicrobiia bacterium]
MRVVLDANIWVSAAIRTGPAHRIVQSWLSASGSFEVVICTALIAEVEEVLTQRPRMRKWIALDVAEHFVETLRVLADVVPDPVEVEATTRDVDDDYLVALAREHGADYIVTGDKDLLEWPDQRPPVLAPAAFAELVGE